MFSLLSNRLIYNSLQSLSLSRSFIGSFIIHFSSIHHISILSCTRVKAEAKLINKVICQNISNFAALETERRIHTGTFLIVNPGKLITKKNIFLIVWRNGFRVKHRKPRVSRLTASKLEWQTTIIFFHALITVKPPVIWHIFFLLASFLGFVDGNLKTQVY